MSRLRLAASSAVVKLAQEPCYHEIITLEQYQLCALAINVRKQKGWDCWAIAVVCILIMHNLKLDLASNLRHNACGEVYWV